MAAVNKVFILGNLGKDPETRYTADGAAITNITVATSRAWKDSSGQKQEETEWHRIVFFGRLAEVAGEYLEKGKAVHVQGRLRTRKWQDKDGNDKYTTEIVAEEMQLLGGGGRRDNDDDDDKYNNRGRPAPQSRPAPRQQQTRSQAGTNAADMDDDIPF